jgi:LysM repeat protein
VQKGDLLIHIASQYDVSMQDIIEANAIPNPHSLPIGQELIIPRSKAQILALQPTVTPTPVVLQIVGVGMSRTPAGSLWCMGEVHNELDHAVDLVQVRAILYNADGALLDRATAFTLADVVPSGGTAPFAILFSSSSAAGFASYRMELLSAQPIENWGSRHRALAIEELSWEIEGETIVAIGTVSNQGQASAKDIRVTLTAYGKGDVVVAVRQIQIGMLPAREGQAFVASLVPAGRVFQVDAVAWGMMSAP